MKIEEEITKLKARVAALEKSQGKAGTGKCICAQSEWYIIHHLDPEWAKENVNLMIDHRCALHGEKAQPHVWGRQRELTLTVSWFVWESLRIKHEGIEG